MALPRGFRFTSPWERSELLFLAVLGEVKYNPESFRDGFWPRGQNETGEIPLWLCLEDSRFQEFFYLVIRIANLTDYQNG